MISYKFVPRTHIPIHINTTNMQWQYIHIISFDQLSLNQGIYTGAVQNGLPHGTGIIRYNEDDPSGRLRLFYLLVYRIYYTTIEIYFRHSMPQLAHERKLIFMKLFHIHNQIMINRVQSVHVQLLTKFLFQILRTMAKGRTLRQRHHGVEKRSNVSQYATIFC